MNTISTRLIPLIPIQDVALEARYAVTWHKFETKPPFGQGSDTQPLAQRIEGLQAKSCRTMCMQMTAKTMASIIHILSTKPNKGKCDVVAFLVISS